MRHVMAKTTLSLTRCVVTTYSIIIDIAPIDFSSDSSSFLAIAGVCRGRVYPSIGLELDLAILVLILVLEYSIASDTLIPLSASVRNIFLPFYCFGFHFS